MDETNWWQYLSELMGGDTPTVAARKAGISASNFTRWKQGARADPDFVVKIARAYEANVLEALVSAGFITPEEAGMEEGARVVNLQEAAQRAKTAADDVRWAAMRLESIAFDLTGKRERVTQLHSNTTPADVEPLPYAANRRELEPEEGDDDYGPGA